MTTSDSDQPELHESVLFWLATLCAARANRDRVLEQLARRRLAMLGVRIVFDNEHQTPPPPKEGTND